MEGRSLKPLIEGNTLPPKIALSMVLEKNPVHSKMRKGTIAIWEGDYKLIYYIEKDKTLLFNLRVDPQELRDIKGHNLEVAGRLEDIVIEAVKKDRLTL